MEKRILIWSAASIGILLLLPWLLISLVPADSCMLAILLMLFLINPFYSIATGIFAAQEWKKLYALPVLSSILFSCSAWFIFQMYASALFVYAGIYLVLGIAAMLVSAQINPVKLAKEAARQVIHND